MATKRFPFISHNIQDLYRVIIHDEPDYSDITDPKLISLFLGIFTKDPEKRFDIKKIKQHAWVTNDGKLPMEDLMMDQIVVNPADLKSVITQVVKLNRVMRRFKQI